MRIACKVKRAQQIHHLCTLVLGHLNNGAQLFIKKGLHR